MIEGDRLIGFAADLVRLPSVLGDERAVAERAAEEMRSLGFSEASLDEVGNVVGVVEGRSPGPTVLFDAHMDTVDVLPRDDWSVDPFGGQLDGERLWGRGASDMKGSLAAMVHGVASIAKGSLAGRLVVVGSVQEERIEGAALARVCARFQPDAVVIGEASDLELVRAGRGRAELVLRTTGRPAHASTPNQGDSAVRSMAALMAEIERMELPVHPFVGRGVSCITDIISEPYPAHSVVPSGCRATLERRLVPGETLEGLLAGLRQACERAGAPETGVELARARVTTWTGYEIDRPKWLAPWELPEDDRLVVAGAGALEGIGLEPSLAAYQFCTNAAYSAGEAGIPTLGFGPGREALAHIVDEWVSIDQLVAAGRGYAALATGLSAALSGP